MQLGDAGLGADGNLLDLGAKPASQHLRQGRIRFDCHDCRSEFDENACVAAIICADIEYEIAAPDELPKKLANMLALHCGIGSQRSLVGVPQRLVYAKLPEQVANHKQIVTQAPAHYGKCRTKTAAVIA
jgi:hypothetical protein